MRWDQISCNLVIFVFSFFKILKIVIQIWNLTPKVSIELFNLLYLLVPGFIFDQKFGFLIKLNMRSAEISWILVIFDFIFFKILKIVKKSDIWHPKFVPNFSILFIFWSWDCFLTRKSRSWPSKTCDQPKYHAFWWFLYAHVSNVWKLLKFE